ncbi:hypothetical protein Hanom_Chr04g00367671 [Helianthus anomalus]
MTAHRWDVMCGSQIMAFILFQSSSVQLKSLVIFPGCPLRLKLCIRPTVCQ